MATQRHTVTPHPIETLRTWVKTDEIAIPEIQRPFVWEAANVRNLLDSLFRWRDLHDAHPRLLRVMLYDPAVQDIDSTATAIGEAVCDYFGPCDNVTRLHDLLDAASRH